MANLDPWVGVTLAMPQHIMDGTVAANGHDSNGESIVSPMLVAHVVAVHCEAVDGTSYTTYVVNVENETGGFEEVLQLLNQS